MRVFIVLLLLSVGCQSAPSSPFDVYQSPLLSRGIDAKRANNASFDPSKIGDYPEATENVVASTKSDEGNPWRAKKSAPKAKRPKVAAQKGKTLPSLSSKAPLKTRRHDVAMVVETLAANGVEVSAKEPVAVNLYKTCKAKNALHFRPKAIPGDVVFFHNTRDVNRDGRNNDWYTLVGIVSSVDEHQTATVTFYRDRKLTESKLNLLNPDVATIGAQELNSQLREPTANDPPYTQHHSGELFAGFCNLLGKRPEFKMFETWNP